VKKPSTSVKRILIVEDEPAISEVCLRVLTNEGFEVDIADNGNVAQGMLEGKHYDLCLIDIKTPVMNGKQLYQVILGKHQNLAKGTIFTTGDVVDGYTQRFLELAGRPFLSKPFTPDELKTIVRRILKQMGK
jgi:DNA-binding response OmpR family regulator